MNFGTNGISTNDVPTYEAMPAGWYQAQIEKEQERPTSSGGTQLVYVFNVLGQYQQDVLTPSYQNRKVFQGYNLFCPTSPKAEEIARKEIAKLGKAAGLENIRESSELVLKTVDIQLTVVQDAGYEPKNEIKNYRACKSAASFTQQPPVQPTFETNPVTASPVSTPTGTPGTAPWLH